jgi:competence protein ComEC
VVIPAAMIIMTLAVFLFFVAILVPKFSFIPGTLLYGILYLTNGLIFLISELPGAVISGIWIGIFGVVLLYAIIVFVVIAIETQQFKWLKISTALLVLFSLNFSYERIKSNQKSELIIYHTNKNKTLIDAIDRSVNWSIQSENLSNTDIDFLAKNYRMKLGVQTIYSLDKGDRKMNPEFFYHGRLIQFKNTKIQIVDSNQLPQYKVPPMVNYILLENNTIVDLRELSEYFKTKKFILSANNSSWKIDEWKKEASADYELFDIKKEGAFILSVE